jgi:hypothetical protein
VSDFLILGNGSGTPVPEPALPFALAIGVLAHVLRGRAVTERSSHC